MVVLEIDDDIAPLVMNAIARVAKNLDNNVDGYMYGGLVVEGKDAQEWVDMSNKLWALVRKFSK